MATLLAGMKNLNKPVVLILLGNFGFPEKVVSHLSYLRVFQWDCEYRRPNASLETSESEFLEELQMLENLGEISIKLFTPRAQNYWTAQSCIAVKKIGYDYKSQIGRAKNIKFISEKTGASTGPCIFPLHKDETN